MSGVPVRVGLLWRSEWDPVAVDASIEQACRLRGVFAAFAELGVAAVPVVYSDEEASVVRERLLELDGVLVWVNPIEQGLDRSVLDPLLRDVADAGVWVSAHPEVILRIATKRVLVDTAHMSWATDTHLYESIGQLRKDLPERLGVRSRVLKQLRGMGGIGVWKVERSADGNVLVQHAASRDTPELVPLEDFLDRCESYFAGGGAIVEQPYQERLAEGMIRVYLSHDEVVGFAHQYPRGLLDPTIAERLQTDKTFLPADEARFRSLRRRVEAEWVPELQRTAALERASLPVIWDIDLFLGDATGSETDAYVLCEINASSTFAFPEHAMAHVARAALDRITEAEPGTRPRPS